MDDIEALIYDRYSFHFLEYRTQKLKPHVGPSHRGANNEVFNEEDRSFANPSPLQPVPGSPELVL